MRISDWSSDVCSSDLQTTAAHALDDVLRSADGAGNDMNPHFQTQPAHAYGFAYVLLRIHNELLGQYMQHLLVGRDVHRLGRFDHPCHVGGGHFLVFDGYHAAGIETGDMAACNTGVDLAYLAVGHELGLFQRTLYRIDGRFDIDHHPFAHALRSEEHTSELKSL